MLVFSQQNNGSGWLLWLKHRQVDVHLFMYLCVLAGVCGCVRTCMRMGVCVCIYKHFVMMFVVSAVHL